MNHTPALAAHGAPFTGEERTTGTVQSVRDGTPCFTSFTNVRGKMTLPSARANNLLHVYANSPRNTKSCWVVHWSRDAVRGCKHVYPFLVPYKILNYTSYMAYGNRKGVVGIPEYLWSFGEK